MLPLNYPFVFNLKNEIKYLIPDTNHRQKILIKRKYPFNNDLHKYNQEFQKIIIEASNHPNFQTVDTISCELSTSHTTYSQGKNKTNKKFQYWRISHPYKIPLAELILLDAQGEVVKGTHSLADSLAFDNNPLTYIYFGSKKKIVIDFNIPLHVSQVICLPRSDGNGIYPGNDYELFYHDLNGWQSLGRRIATNYFLEYNNVPQGALLWLHNHTTGIEERIFTYEKGKIRFW